MDHAFHFGTYRPSNSPVTVRTVGLLVRQDEQEVVVAQSWGAEPEECLHLIAGCVVEVAPLKRRK